MKLIVGLGNVGKEYDDTRHNIGFHLLNNYLKDIKWSNNKYGLFYKDNNVIFLKPSTFMNLSGDAVQYFVSYFKIEIDDILIIHDDLDLEIGDYKLKKSSSSGGHNGIKSIIKALNSNNFLRLKIGISKPQYADSSDYVLGKFSSKEKNIIEKNLNILQQIIDDYISNDSVEKLMNKYN